MLNANLNEALVEILKGLVGSLESKMVNRGTANAVEAWASLYEATVGKTTLLVACARDYVQTALAGNDFDEEAELFDCAYGFAADELAKLTSTPTPPNGQDESAKAEALIQTIAAVKNSDLPPTQRRRKLAALQQELIALRGSLAA